MCEACGTGRFCSVSCAESHENHKKYCPVIVSVQEIETEKQIRNSINLLDSEKLPYKLKKKLVSLVGEKPVAKLFLNGVEVEGLWDTGAMVSMVNSDFLRQHFPGVVIRPIQDFIQHDSLKVNAANQTELDLDGVAVLDFGTERENCLFQIPFLVAPS